MDYVSGLIIKSKSKNVALPYVGDRKQIIAALDDVINKSKDNSIIEFFKELKLFYPTTTIGNNLIFILFYPPTNCLISNNSFGNKTGNLLSKYFDLANVSLIDVIPYLHIRKSSDFDQNRFFQLYTNDTAFQDAINLFVIQCLQLEIMDKDNDQRILFLGGKVSSSIFWNCVKNYLDPSLVNILGNIDLGFDVIITPLLIKISPTRTVTLYAFKGIHPSSGMMNPKASKIVRKDLLVLKVLLQIVKESVSNNTDFIEVVRVQFQEQMEKEAKLILENYKKISDHFVTCEDTLGIKLVEMKKQYPSFVYITSIDHINAAVILKTRNPNVGIKVLKYVLNGSIDSAYLNEFVRNILHESEPTQNIPKKIINKIIGSCLLHVLSSSQKLNEFIDNLKDAALHIPREIYDCMISVTSGLSILGSHQRYMDFKDNLKDAALHIPREIYDCMISVRSGLSILGSHQRYMDFKDNLKDAALHIPREIYDFMISVASGLSILGSHQRYMDFKYNLKDEAVHIPPTIYDCMIRNKFNRNYFVSILGWHQRYMDFKDNIKDAGVHFPLAVYDIMIKHKSGLPIFGSNEDYNVLKDNLKDAKLNILPRSIYNIMITKKKGFAILRSSEKYNVLKENLADLKSRKQHSPEIYNYIISDVNYFWILASHERYSNALKMEKKAIEYELQLQLDLTRQEHIDRGVVARKAQKKEEDDQNLLVGEAKVEADRNREIQNELENERLDARAAIIKNISSSAWEDAKNVKRKK